MYAINAWTRDHDKFRNERADSFPVLVPRKTEGLYADILREEFHSLSRIN